MFQKTIMRTVKEWKCGDGYHQIPATGHKLRYDIDEIYFIMFNVFQDIQQKDNIVILSFKIVIVVVVDDVMLPERHFGYLPIGKMDIDSGNEPDPAVFRKFLADESIPAPDVQDPKIPVGNRYPLDY